MSIRAMDEFEAARQAGRDTDWVDEVQDPAQRDLLVFALERLLKDPDYNDLPFRGIARNIVARLGSVTRKRRRWFR